MILAVVNQKGGVGKTTVSLGLAEAATHTGHKVLVVDVDPQANATSGLGVWNPTLSVDNLLAQDRLGCIHDVVISSQWPANGSPAPSLVPSVPTLAAREPQLATDPIGAQDRLQHALEGNNFDVVVIDCPPSLGLLTVNALFAADHVLIVTAPAAWSADGVEQMLRTIERVSDRRSGDPNVKGVLVNNLGRTRDAKYWYTQICERYPDYVLPPVHARAAVAEASAQSLPLRALGARPGATEAAEEFDSLFERLEHE